MQTQSQFERDLRSAVIPTSRRTLIDERGISAYALKGQDWRQTTRGYFVPAGVDRDASPTQRVVEAVPLIPYEGALTGWAAAYVGGVDVLDGRDPQTFRLRPVPLIRGADRGHVPREWVASCRDRLDTGEIVNRHGIPITVPLRATFDGARQAPDLAEAVVVIDAMLAAGRITVETFTRYVDAHAGWRGVGGVRRALALAEAGSRSPWESRLRVEYVVGASLPRPLVNRPVYDSDGRLLGIPDLLDSDAGLATEFDGQHHRDREQHRADNVREERLESAGLVVVRLDSRDLLDHLPEARARLRSGWQRGMARDQARDRWTIDPLPSRPAPSGA
jgi:hypothetical protein